MTNKSKSPVSAESLSASASPRDLISAFGVGLMFLHAVIGTSLVPLYFVQYHSEAPISGFFVSCASHLGGSFFWLAYALGLIAVFGWSRLQFHGRRLAIRCLADSDKFGLSSYNLQSMFVHLQLMFVRDAFALAVADMTIDELLAAALEGSRLKNQRRFVFCLRAIEFTMARPNCAPPSH